MESLAIDLEGPAGPDVVGSALVFPLVRPVERSGLYGFVVAGVSPRLELDESYRTFLHLVGEQVTAAISNASAYEEGQRTEAALCTNIAELQRTARFSEMFVGILGHDLRNPLSAISMAAGLSSRRAETQAIAKPVSRIRVSADRMARMIEQLLDLTRIRLGGGVPIEREEVDFSEICRAVIDELEPAQGCGIQFEQVGDLVGLWDRDRLAQLLSNLCGNACQHRRANTSVLLRVDGSQSSSVMLEVWNEGVISAELLPAIFDPMQAGRGKRRAGSSGLGIGLYISQQTVVAHGGSIRVESSEENGTRFVVELARRPSQSADRPPEVAS